MNRTAPSTLIAALALLVLLGVALAAGCASTPSGSTATKTPTPAGTTAAGTVTTTGTSVSSSGSAAVAAVSADSLVPFVPKTAGAWKLDGEVQKVTMKGGQGQDFTQVSGDYVKNGDDTVKANVVIQDTATANTPYKEMWGTFRSVETNDGWYKSVTVKGQPGWKFYSKSSNEYGQWILAGDRYIVYMNVEGGSEADLDALVNSMDLAGLAAVK